LELTLTPGPQDTIDALRHAPELRDIKAGQCTDLRCRKRDLEMYSSQVDATNQIVSLRNETYDLLDRIKKCKAELMSQRPGEVVPGVYQVVEQGTKPVVACLDGFEELKLNLKSFFIIFPAHDQEWEQVVVDSFISNLQYYVTNLTHNRTQCTRPSCSICRPRSAKRILDGCARRANGRMITASSASERACWQ